MCSFLSNVMKCWKIFVADDTMYINVFISVFFLCIFWTNKQKTPSSLYLSKYPLKCLMTISAFLYWKLSNEISYESGWSISIIKTVQWNIKAGHNWQNNVRTSIDMIIIIISFNLFAFKPDGTVNIFVYKEKLIQWKFENLNIFMHFA